MTPFIKFDPTYSFFLSFFPSETKISLCRMLPCSTRIVEFLRGIDLISNNCSIINTSIIPPQLSARFLEGYLLLLEKKQASTFVVTQLKSFTVHSIYFYVAVFSTAAAANSSPLYRPKCQGSP